MYVFRKTIRDVKRRKIQQICSFFDVNFEVHDNKAIDDANNHLNNLIVHSQHLRKRQRQYIRQMKLAEKHYIQLTNEKYGTTKNDYVSLRVGVQKNIAEFSAQVELIILKHKKEMDQMRHIMNEIRMHKKLILDLDAAKRKLKKAIVTKDPKYIDQRSLKLNLAQEAHDTNTQTILKKCEHYQNIGTTIIDISMDDFIKALGRFHKNYSEIFVVNEWI